MANWLNPYGWSNLGSTLFAVAAARRNDGAPRSSLLWYVALGLLTCAILIGIVVAARLWREIHEDEEPATNDELLAEFRQAYADGKIDEAEFQRVSALLAGPGRSPPAAETNRPKTSTERGLVQPEMSQGTDEHEIAPRA